jgi:hypothetical protein
MPGPDLSINCDDRSNAKLLAIVAVERADRVRCGQPNCGCSVYRRIHVVRENGQLLVLGSTCFSKRYGSNAALGGAQYGGGEGRSLTDAERQLLVGNTEALLARFEEEAALLRLSKARLAPPTFEPKSVVTSPLHLKVSAHKETPWEWVKPWSSILYLKLNDGSGWIRAERRDGQNVLVPWPVFDGWDEALPPLFGHADDENGGYILPDVPRALQYLRNQAEWETKPGRWSDVMKEIAFKSRAPDLSKHR